MGGRGTQIFGWALGLLFCVAELIQAATPAPRVDPGLWTDANRLQGVGTTDRVGVSSRGENIRVRSARRRVA